MTDDVTWFREPFPTFAEAMAFKMGLQWGDEPRWFVDCVEQCRSKDGCWDVVFAHTEDLDEYARQQEEESPRDTCRWCGGHVTFHAVNCPELLL